MAWLIACRTLTSPNGLTRWLGCRYVVIVEGSVRTTAFGLLFSGATRLGASTLSTSSWPPSSPASRVVSFGITSNSTRCMRVLARGPVARVLLEDRRCARFEALQLYGPLPIGWVEQAAGANLLEVRRRIDRGAEEGDVGEERCPGVLEPDRHRVRIGGIDPVDLGQQVRPQLLGIARPVQAELDIARGQLAAVVEGHIWTQVEGVCLAVLGDVPPGRQVRLQAGAVVAGAQQLVVDVDHHPDAGVVRRTWRVEALRADRPADRKGARCPRRTGVALACRQRAAQHQRTRQQGTAEWRDFRGSDGHWPTSSPPRGCHLVTLSLASVHASGALYTHRSRLLLGHPPRRGHRDRLRCERGPRRTLQQRCRWRESGGRGASAIGRPAGTILHTTGRVAVYPLWPPRYRSRARPVKLPLAPCPLPWSGCRYSTGAWQRAMHREGGQPWAATCFRRFSSVCRAMHRLQAPSPTVALPACRT